MAPTSASSLATAGRVEAPALGASPMLGTAPDATCGDMEGETDPKPAFKTASAACACAAAAWAAGSWDRSTEKAEMVVASWSWPACERAVNSENFRMMAWMSDSGTEKSIML